MYLNIIELADSFGVEERVIQDWVRHESLPHVPDRGRLLFDRAQVIAWASQRGHGAKAGFLAAQRPALHGGPSLETMLQAGGIWRNVAPENVIAVFEEILGRLPGATPPVRQLLAQRLGAPDGISWATIGDGIALPHLRSPAALGREGGICALLLLCGPVAEPAPDGVPVTRLVFFVAPSPRAHLEMLGQLSAALMRGELKRLIREAASDEEIFAALAAGERVASAGSAGAAKT